MKLSPDSTHVKKGETTLSHLHGSGHLQCGWGEAVLGPGRQGSTTWPSFLQPQGDFSTERNVC